MVKKNDNKIFSVYAALSWNVDPHRNDKLSVLLSMYSYKTKLPDTFPGTRYYRQYASVYFDYDPADLLFSSRETDVQIRPNLSFAIGTICE